jgi:tRNA(Ile)-lysidine synthase
MYFDILPFLQKYITPDEKFIVACSTGPDSMFLLHQILQTDYKKNMVVAYFNHKLRPEADDEEVFIEEMWKKKRFTVEIGSANILMLRKKYPSRSLEELAREKRYQFFDALLHIHNARYVITAHHLDDRIETFFFNLARGTKLTGLINMTELSGNILRPLLSLEKREILSFLENHTLEFSIDTTNLDTDIARNKMRLAILPEFETINTNYKGNISHLLSYFEEMKSFVDLQVQEFLWDEDFFEIVEFHSLSLFLQKEVVRYIYFISNQNSTIGLSEGNIEEVLRFIWWKNNKTVKEIHGLKMKKDGKKILY